MAGYVNLYLGSGNDLSDGGRDIFERAILTKTEATRSPGGLAKHYNVKITVKTKCSEEKYSTTIDSRRINSWLDRFEPKIRQELTHENGIEAKYSKESPEERNTTIIELLSKLVPFWINTEDCERV
jgi:hypothetical protein